MPADPTNLPRIPSLWPPRRAPNFDYALEDLRFEGDTLEAPLGGLSANLALAAARGWERQLLASAVTGNPKHLVQLFKTPHPYPGGAAVDGDVPEDPVALLGELAVLRQYRRMLEDVSEFQRTVLAPLPYDPAPESKPRLQKNHTLLLVRARIAEGAMQRFIALKQDFFIDEVGKDGWQLIFAGYVTSSSRPHSSIVQCWALPSPDTLVLTMSRMAQNGTYRTYLAPCITEENQLLYSVISSDS